jgi:hypothetical protein
MTGLARAGVACVRKRVQEALHVGGVLTGGNRIAENDYPSAVAGRMAHRNTDVEITRFGLGDRDSEHNRDRCKRGGRR